MTAPAHIITGAAIWLVTRNHYLALPLAFFSHQILDQWCLYHPDKLLLLNSWGKRLLFGAGVLSLILLIIFTRNIVAWIYGILVAWMGFDLQWVFRWMGFSTYKIHDLFGRRFEFTSSWKLIVIEALVMFYGLLVIKLR